MPKERTPDDLDIIEAEYHELASIFKIFKNFRYGLRIRTTKENYKEDYRNLVIEVKTRLNDIILQSKKQREMERGN